MVLQKQAEAASAVTYLRNGFKELDLDNFLKLGLTRDQVGILLTVLNIPDCFCWLGDVSDVDLQVDSRPWLDVFNFGQLIIHWSPRLLSVAFLPWLSF